MKIVCKTLFSQEVRDLYGQKKSFKRFSTQTSRNFPPTIVYAIFLNTMGLSCVSMKTVKNHERMELSSANNVYTTEFSVENRLEHGLPI